jgi:hypothetical protein
VADDTTTTTTTTTTTVIVDLRLHGSPHDMGQGMGDGAAQMVVRRLP